jgi:hypothetical protein
MKLEVMKVEVDPVRVLEDEILHNDNFDISKWSRKDLEILRRVIKTLEEAFYPRLYFHTHPEMEGRCNLSKDHVIIDKEVYDVIFNNLNERK